MCRISSTLLIFSFVVFFQQLCHEVGLGTASQHSVPSITVRSSYNIVELDVKLQQK